MNVAVDAMGGDHAPEEIVKGCIMAVREDQSINVILVGKEEEIKRELAKYNYSNQQIEVVHASQVIDVHEAPVVAIRRKKDASMVKAFNLVKEKKADAFISAGSTGAILAGGTLIIGRIKGIERPALGSLIPNRKGVTLLIDCGANAEAKPSYLVQFAHMGSIYLENIVGIRNPKVAIVNIGEEKSKGNTLAKEAYALLEKEDLNFIGNIEARDITEGKADVIVCDAFVGNIILKYTEGLGLSLLSMLKESIMSSIRGKIGGMILKPVLSDFRKQFDYTEYGGAPLLGLEGLVVKSHGSSNAYAIKNTVIQCHKFTSLHIKEKIEQNINHK